MLISRRMRRSIMYVTNTTANTEQSGAVEACWAHNPEVRGSKPRSANFFLLHFFFFYYYYFKTVFFQILSESFDTNNIWSKQKLSS